MLTLDMKTSLHDQDRRLQVPMTLEHGQIEGTQFCVLSVNKKANCNHAPEPSVLGPPILEVPRLSVSRVNILIPNPPTPLTVCNCDLSPSTSSQ
jgi:hypothetical protein